MNDMKTKFHKAQMPNTKNAFSIDRDHGRPMLWIWYIEENRPVLMQNILINYCMKLRSYIAPWYQPSISSLAE
jgi:hypothetical protein